jgi:hypothetical protein
MNTYHIDFGDYLAEIPGTNEKFYEMLDVALIKGFYGNVVGCIDQFLFKNSPANISAIFPGAESMVKHAIVCQFISEATEKYKMNDIRLINLFVTLEIELISPKIGIIPSYKIYAAKDYEDNEEFKKHLVLLLANYTQFCMFALNKYLADLGNEFIHLSQFLVVDPISYQDLLEEHKNEFPKVYIMKEMIVRILKDLGLIK